MKNRALPNEKVDEIKRFILSSCKACTEENSKHLNFHKTLIKRYFEARNVQIFYEKREIIAEIPVGQAYVPISFSCLDVPTFLCSCIKEDQENLEFYRTYMNMHTVTSAATEGQIHM